VSGRFSLFTSGHENHPKNLGRSILAVLFIAVSPGRTLAYDHDDKGWFDENHQHHPFIQHSGHQGYWDHDKSGAQIFINVR
jgi:hypothetical protein